MLGLLAPLSAANRASRTTALGLVVANLMPLIGIIALGWSPSRAARGRPRECERTVD